MTSTHQILLWRKDLPRHTTGQMVSRGQSGHHQNFQSRQVYICGSFQRFHCRGSKRTPSRDKEQRYILIAELMKLIENWFRTKPGVLCGLPVAYLLFCKDTFITLAFKSTQTSYLVHIGLLAMAIYGVEKTILYSL